MKFKVGDLVKLSSRFPTPYSITGKEMGLARIESILRLPLEVKSQDWNYVLSKQVHYEDIVIRILEHKIHGYIGDVYEVNSFFFVLNSDENTRRKKEFKI